MTAGEFMQIVGPDDTNLLNVARATAGYYLATFDPIRPSATPRRIGSTWA